MKQNQRHPKQSRMSGSLQVAALVGGGVVLAALVALAIEPLYQYFAESHAIASGIAILLIAGAVLWFFVYWQFDNLNRLIRASAVELDHDEITARKYLITGCSIIGKAQLDAIKARCIEGGFTDIARICADTDRTNGEAGKLGGWQQQLRLIHFLRSLPAEQGKALEKVYVITNNTGQVPAFMAFLQACFPGLQIIGIPEAPKPKTAARNPYAPDYEHFEYMSLAFEEAFEAITEDFRKTAKDLSGARQAAEAATYIDVTPGQKVFSIAAAIQTLNRKAMFLYVTTWPDRERVKQQPGNYTIFGYDADAQFTVSRS